jgi:hypothetical protein
VADTTQPDDEGASEPCYIGYSSAPCGHMIAAIVDHRGDEAWQKEIAETLREWLLRGMIVKRALVRDARSGLQSCEQCCPERRKDIPAQVELLMSEAGRG